MEDLKGRALEEPKQGGIKVTSLKGSTVRSEEEVTVNAF